MIPLREWDYYNDFDPGAVAWMRELMAQGHIPPGEIDTRSILDVQADELRGFRRVHFFAGIGGWALALQLAGFEGPCWTGSPPCQPFSAAGQQKGRDDARHLAPKFISLVGAARPGMLFGEQVASSEVFGKAAKRAQGNAVAPPQWAWIDDLSDRLEAARYAVGASDFPSAGVGAPHIRQRTFFGAVSHEWLADAEGDRRADGSSQQRSGRQVLAAAAEIVGIGDRRASGRMADADGRNACAERQQCRRELRQQPENGGTGWMADCQGSGRGEERPNDRGRTFGDSAEGIAAGSGAGRSHSGLADAERLGRDRRQGLSTGRQHVGADAGWLEDHNGPVGFGEAGDGSHRPSPLHGFWGNADWLFCRDGKWRPVESSVLGVADGLSQGLDHLRLERNGEDENGTESRACAAEVLQNVWGADGAPAVQRAPRGQGSLYAPSILRSGLHGKGLRGRDQGDERQEQPSPIGQDAPDRVRDMRAQGPSRSSPGREPAEQRSGQSAEPLRFLSQEGTPPEACFPLATGVRHRAALLRGYGNAINPHAAAQFIKAFSESVDGFRLTPSYDLATCTGDIFG